MNKEALNQPNYKLQRAVALGATALALLGANKIANAHDAQPTYASVPTAAQFAEMPLQSVTLSNSRGVGTLDPIGIVNPGFADAAWKSKRTTEELHNMEDFIQGQHPGLIQPGEHVEVPMVEVNGQPTQLPPESVTIPVN